jgi:hypothetical protein
MAALAGADLKAGIADEHPDSGFAAIISRYSQHGGQSSARPADPPGVARSTECELA